MCYTRYYNKKVESQSPADTDKPRISAPFKDYQLHVTIKV